MGANMRGFVSASFLLLWAACGGAEGGGGTEAAGTTGATGSSGAEPTTGAAMLPGSCASPIEPVLSSSARLTVDARGRMIDEFGRDVQLRGVNTGGRSKWAPFVPFPIEAEAELAAVEAAADEFFARLTGWGINAVRMPFSWEALEPSPGSYDARYLDRYAAMVDAGWRHRMRVVVDFHQDVYASPFCGDGFPPWTLPGEPGPPRRDCPNWGLKYVNDPEVRAAFDRFWADEGQIQGKFVAMWAQMIARVADHPGVVGLEILNEPGWGTAVDLAAWKQAVLTPFHERVIAEMRALAGEEPLIFYDNPGTDALGFQEVEHARPAGEGLVYAPHVYDPGLIQGMPAIGTMPEVLIGEFATFAATAGVGVLVGEFGIGDGAPGGEAWLTKALAAIDAGRLGGTLWECSQSAELWNEEDLSVLAADGSERATLDVFVRPYLRAVAGAFEQFSWDGSVATGRWTSDGGVTELALPRRLFGDAEVEVELTTLAGPAGTCFTLDAERGELRVQGPAGAQVEVRVTR